MWSMNHTMAETAMVAAFIPRNKIRQLEKRSSGRSPHEYAKEDIPRVAFSGRVKRRLGADGFTYRGEDGSANWSAKFWGGEKGRVARGFQ